MVCPKCHSEKVKTIAAVNAPYNETFRRKQCQQCGHIFYTDEMEVEPNKRFRSEWAKYGFKAPRGKL